MKQSDITISEVKLIYRPKVKASERLQVKTSEEAFDIFIEHWDIDSIEYVEEFKVKQNPGNSFNIKRRYFWHCD
jgi:DNA repair protein RadC